MSTKTQVLGDYIPPDTRGIPHGQLQITLYPRDFLGTWRRCGMTADYLAGFLACQLDNFDHALNVLSTVLNELVENCVKFSVDPNAAVSLEVASYGNVLTLQARNAATPTQSAQFAEFLRQLLTEDTTALLWSQIDLKEGELFSADEDAGSGLGLITITKDFMADLGVQICEQAGTDQHEITVQVHLHVKLIAQT